MERIPQVSAKERTHTGATIRELRQARYLTLEEAARSIGVSASYLFRLERNKGDRSLKTLAAIASFFNFASFSKRRLGQYWVRRGAGLARFFHRSIAERSLRKRTRIPLAVMFSERGCCDFSPAAPVAKRW